MNATDLDDLLAQADPAKRGDSASPTLRKNVIARLDDEARKEEKPNHRGRLRTVGIAATAVGLSLAVGSAAAIGWIPDQVREAFSSTNAIAPDLHSSAAAKDAVLMVSASGPEGTEIAVWVSPLPSPTVGRCVAVVGSLPGMAQHGKSFEESAGCSQTAEGAALPGDTLDEFRSSWWQSPATGKGYYRFAGLTGRATTIELKQPGKRVRRLAVGNGWFVGAVPADQAQRTVVIARDGAGQVIARTNAI